MTGCPFVGLRAGWGTSGGSSFLCLKKTNTTYKKVLNGLAWLLLTSDDEHRFS
jgi:hypothetical protein